MLVKKLSVFFNQMQIRITMFRRAAKAPLTRATYRGADKSLARPGRKQATATEYFEFHVSNL